MKKILLTILAMGAMVLPAAAAAASYKITSECDTVYKALVKGISLGSRNAHQFNYEYLSKDGDGKDVTISGVVIVPSNVYDGSAPCDGVVLYNHFTAGRFDEAMTLKGQEVPKVFLASPLKPNYILVASDFIGLGSSAERPLSFLCGDINARNSLDGLLAARQLMADKQIPQGKYLFNCGYSQGGTETLFVSKLRDMEYKQKGITFDKTFCGGGPTDLLTTYKEFLRIKKLEHPAHVALLIISLNETYHLGLDYKKVFTEPLSSHVDEWVLSKQYSIDALNGKMPYDSIQKMLQPEFLDIESEAAKPLVTKMEEIALMKDWEIDPQQNYFFSHSRHDDYVPIQGARAIIPWMKTKGFKPSVVPGKTSLQTNNLLFKVNHEIAGGIWFIQTAAAIQFWPVLYYEGEQNRFYNSVVKDLNLMKVIKYLESWGIDLRKIISQGGLSRSLQSDVAEGIADGSLQPDGSVRQLASMRRVSIFEIMPKITAALAKVDLTFEDAVQMLDDSGITLADILAVVAYLTSSPSASRELSDMAAGSPEAPVYLMKLYEQTLASWLLTAGLDVRYNEWGY